MSALQLPQIFIDLQVPLICLNSIIALAIGPQHRSIQVLLSFPILVLLTAQSLYREWDGGWGYHYGINCSVMCLIFTWIDWILLGSPDKQAWGKIKYLNQKDGTVVEKKEDSPPRGFLNRAWWAARLATTNRYVGWSQQVKNVRMEVGADYPRWLFVLRKAARTGLFYLAKDFFCSYTAASPHGSWVGSEHIKPAVGFAGYSFLHRIKFVWLQIIITYVTLEALISVYNVVGVATGLANPRDCPGLFGDLQDTFTVRKAWSSVWHQQVRQTCSAPGTYLVREVLKLRKGSFASKYIQLFATFGCSGIIHGVAAMLCHRSLEDNQAIKVFLLQAVFIMFEDYAIDFGKRVGLEDSFFWRLVGLVWTIFALGVSLDSWLDSQLYHGMWVHPREYDFFGVGPKI